jgi:hypothetical protein
VNVASYSPPISDDHEHTRVNEQMDEHAADSKGSHRSGDRPSDRRCLFPALTMEVRCSECIIRLCECLSCLLRLLLRLLDHARTGRLHRVDFATTLRCQCIPLRTEERFVRIGRHDGHEGRDAAMGNTRRRSIEEAAEAIESAQVRGSADHQPALAIMHTHSPTDTTLPMCNACVPT